jgi:thioredoxin 1
MGSFGSPEADRLERLDERAFDGKKLLRPGTRAVAFLAEWCGFCRDFGPQFAEIGTRPQLAVADLTDLNSPLWEEFEVQVVPTVVVFRDGRPVLRRDGVAGEGLSAADLAAIRRALHVS